MLEVATKTRVDTACATLAGELDLATTAKLEVALSRLEDAEPAYLVLDLAWLSFMDVSGLRVILEAAKRADASGTTLVVTRPQLQVQRLLSLTGADAALLVADDDDQLSAA